MADEGTLVEEGTSAGQSPLVAVTFEKNVHRKQKYLEAEPKALGITQISLSMFQISCVAMLLAQDLSTVYMYMGIPFFISSLLVVIAGSVAVAAQNLQLATLRACLGMQIVACGASVFNVVISLIAMEESPYYCWHYQYDNLTLHYGEICHNIDNTNSHLFAETVVIQVALFAIAGTLAAYCCKVANCCSPAPKMPVIIVQAPPVQQ